MKNLQKVSLSVVVILLCATTYTHAQQKACPIPSPSPYKHTAYIATRYDARAGVMRTVLEHPATLGDAAQPLYLSASFSYADPARPRSSSRDTIDFALVSLAPVARFGASHDLRVFADGHEVMWLAPARYTVATDELNRAVEWTLVRFSAAALLEVTRAKDVEVSLNGVRYALTENHLEALRDLASLMRLPSFAERRDDYSSPPAW